MELTLMALLILSVIIFMIGAISYLGREKEFVRVEKRASIKNGRGSDKR